MRILLSTALVALYSFSAFAAEAPVVSAQPMQVSENRLLPTPYAQPYQVNPYMAQVPVRAQAPVMPAEVEAQPAAKTDIMWMNSF